MGNNKFSFGRDTLPLATVSAPQPPPINSWVKQLSRFAYWLLRPWYRRRIAAVHIEWVQGMPLVVHPEVLSPVVFRSGAWFAALLAGGDLPGLEPPAGDRGDQGQGSCLDLGCGSGVCALMAARLGFQVTAVDINPMAVRCTRINALLNCVEDRVEVLAGDLFQPLGQRRFDLVCFNPPFYRGDPEPGFDQAWRSREVFEHFAAGLERHLTDQGQALLLLSTEGAAATQLALLQRHGYRVAEVKRRHFGTEIMSLYSVRPGPVH